MEAANKPRALIDFSRKVTISKPSMRESFTAGVYAEGWIFIGKSDGINVCHNWGDRGSELGS